MPTSHDRKQRLLTFAREMRKAPSDAERKLWHSLRRHQLDHLHFRRQHPIGPYIADFACAEYHVVVEVDGFQHDDDQEYDERRTAYLNEKSWRVIRFSASDVCRCHDAVLDAILDFVRPPP